MARPLNAEGHPEARGKTASGLVISGEEVGSYSSEHFGLLQVTFENRSSEWIRLGRVSIDFGNAAGRPAVSIVEGPDIGSWFSATLQRNVIRDTNEAIALGTLLAIGATVDIIGQASGQRGVAAAGNVLELGAVAGLTIDTPTDVLPRAQDGAPFPDSHLLALPFAVPPGLFSKRWVLLYTRESGRCIRSMRLDYEVENEGPEQVLLVFRRYSDRSEWQRRACAE